MYRFTIAAMAYSVAFLALALGWFADHQNLSSEMRSQAKEIEVLQWRLERRQFQEEYADGKMLNPIRELLDYDSEEMLQKIAFFGETGDIRYAPLLIYLLADTDERTSVEAERSLIKISRRQPSPASIRISQRPVSNLELMKWREWYSASLSDSDEASALETQQ